MVVVSDVCDTLYYSNTTIDYGFYVLKKSNKHLKLLLLNIIFSKMAPFYYILAIITRLGKMDIHKLILIKFLKGFSQEDLYNYAEKFVSEFLKDKKIDKVFDLINNKKKKKMILLSSSIDPVVSAIAKSLGAEFASSTLEYIEGVCTGKLNFEMKGKKLVVLKSKFGIPDSDWLMISDNLSDANIVSLAPQKIAVVYTQSQKKFWEKLNIQTINVNER